ncbi:MAG: orotate phosphoribosyltransferase [Candidatus Aenigmarchaeota archaeon]|nr:orotate phosphoribosyltransferase [Candidatus Aenigmarchaeota archaeon]
MDVPGLCSNCGGEAKPACSCILCGAIVCSKCFLPEKGTCKKCSFKSV